MVRWYLWTNAYILLLYHTLLHRWLCMYHPRNVTLNNSWVVSSMIIYDNSLAAMRPLQQQRIHARMSQYQMNYMKTKEQISSYLLSIVFLPVHFLNFKDMWLLSGFKHTWSSGLDLKHARIWRIITHRHHIRMTRSSLCFIHFCQKGVITFNDRFHWQSCRMQDTTHLLF